MLTSPSGTLRAQTVQDVQDTGIDLKFHKFQPAVAPENAVRAAATQAETDALTQQQIVALEQEKASRTPAQRKIDSNLLYTMRMLAGKPAAPGVDFLNTGVDLDQDNNLVVDITANVTDQLLQQMNAAGVLVWYFNRNFHSIRAVVPPSQMENIAALPDVKFITPKVESITASARLLRGAGVQRPDFAQRAARIRKLLSAALQARAAAAATNGTGQGAVTTEGDATHRAFDARTTFLVNGSGLKIGVLSDSANFNGALAAAQATGDMPPTCPAGPPCFTMVQDFPGPPTPTNEGLAMLEIVYDMAPGASLFFATADISEASFAQNILDLRNISHCDIIIDDVFYFDEPVFQDGIVAQAVTTVAQDGALYFSSAGNEGNVDSNTAGYFEGDFNDTGSPAFTFPGGAKTGTIHNFGTVASPVNGDIITARGNRYTLNWADPAQGALDDYDLFVVSSAGVVKSSSANIQNGSLPPFEQIAPPALAAGDRLVVFKTATSAPLLFAINTIRGRLTVNTTGQTHGHSAAGGVGVYSVAATPAAQPFSAGFPTGPFPNPFNTGNGVELFTSDGPRRIIFNADGTPITPGDFSSTGGTVRNKPDITGADGVHTTLPANSGLNPFYGTSAAAPSAASVAALVKSANPLLTQSEIRTALTSTAVDIMAAGFDRDSGNGIVMAWEAVNSLGVTGFANPQLGTIAAGENPGNGNTVIEAGEGGQLSIQLRNTSGIVDATGITATLTTATPGVTITLPGTSTYPDLAAGTGVANNITPFTFTVASDAACSLTINFTLTVNYTGGPQRILTFSVPTGVVTISNNLGTLPPASLGITTATGQQTNRVTRNGVVSACGVQKVYPGTTTTAGTRTFDSYTFNACKAACVTPILNSSNAISLFEVAYTTPFDPANIATNYAADAGSSTTPQTFGLSTNAATSYTVVVSDVPGTATGTNYTLQLPACVLNCNINNVPVALAHNVTVTAATPGGTANASIDNGSSDPDGDALTITQTPAGPYPQGDTTVLLTVTDTKGATAQASAVVTVTNAVAPVIIKAFGAASVPLNASTSLSFTLQNNNTTALTGVAFTDALPAGLVVATPNGFSGSCGSGVITATQNTGVISLSGGSIAASSSCNFQVNVTGTAAGLQNNTTGNVTSTEGGTGGTASASVSVVAPPSIAKAFAPNTIALNATTSLTFTITNPAANVDALTGVAYSDTLPVGLTVANATATVCGGTLTTTAPTGIALSGATIAVNSQCQFSVTVTGAAVGTYTNTTGNVTSTNGGTGNTASANLSVGKTDQTITFGPLAGKTFGDPDFTVSASASSGLTVTFAATGNCSLSGSTVHITAAGSCTVTASQAGDSNFNAAPSVPQTFSIAKASQTITFGALPNRPFGTPDFTVSASASSGLTVGFAATGNCTLTGVTVHITSAGSCTITASQAGDTNFNAAASVPRSFTITPGDDFTLALSLPAITITAGQSATQHITLTPNPSTLTLLNFSCSGLPAKTNCSFAPNPISPGSTPTDITMTVTTTAATTAALERPRGVFAAWLAFGSFGVMGLVLIGARKKNRKGAVLFGVLSLMIAMLAVGCGGHTTTPGTPQGTSTITVIGTTAGFSHSTTFTLTVN